MMHHFTEWLNSLSDTDPAKALAAKASITYHPKLGRFHVYDSDADEDRKVFVSVEELKRHFGA